MKGRKPKPAEVHAANGNPSRHSERRRPSAVNLPKGMPAPFPHLSDAQRAAWLEIGAVLLEMKVLSTVHGHALEQAACNLVEIRELRDYIARNKRFVTGRATNGSKKITVSPAQLALSDAEKRYRAMMEQFGMTPSAATRVHAKKEEDDKPKNPAEKYFGTKPTLVVNNDKR